MSPEDFVEVDRETLDDLEPLIWWEVRAPGGEEDFSDDEGRITGPIVEELEDLLQIGWQSRSDNL
jgi:hypothetical protein